MSRGADELNTTSFAMLGMLAIQPWTTYELTKHLDRSLRPVWPRARSNLYNEPKKLVAHGMATASEELVGRRPEPSTRSHPKVDARCERWLESQGRSGARVRAVPEGLLRRPGFEGVGAGSAVDGSRMGATKGAAEHRDRAPVRGRRPGPSPSGPRSQPWSGGSWKDYVDMVGKWAEWADERHRKLAGRPTTRAARLERARGGRPPRTRPLRHPTPTFSGLAGTRRLALFGYCPLAEAARTPCRAPGARRSPWRFLWRRSARSCLGSVTLPMSAARRTWPRAQISGSWPALVVEC